MAAGILLIGLAAMYFARRAGRSGSTELPRVRKVIKHPQLGDLSFGKYIPDSLEGGLPYEGRTLSLTLFAVDGDRRQIFDLAAKVAASLSQLDRAARQAIASDLLDTYNDNWNGHDEQQADGTWAVVGNAPLSAEEFVAKMTLHSVSIDEGNSVTLTYDDGELFLGHYVSVASNQGTDFSDAKGEISG
jgi:hypothetical protein